MIITKTEITKIEYNFHFKGKKATGADIKIKFSNNLGYKWIVFLESPIKLWEWWILCKNS